MQLFLGEQFRGITALTAPPGIKQKDTVCELQRMFREMRVNEKRQSFPFLQFLHGLQNTVLIFKVQIGLRLIEYHKFRLCRQGTRNQRHLKLSAADARAEFSRNIRDTDFLKTAVRNALIVLARLGKKSHMYRAPQ